jgi:hypothetical protein
MDWVRGIHTHRLCQVKKGGREGGREGTGGRKGGRKEGRKELKKEVADGGYYEG